MSQILFTFYMIYELEQAPVKNMANNHSCHTNVGFAATKLQETPVQAITCEIAYNNPLNFKTFCSVLLLMEYVV